MTKFYYYCGHEQFQPEVLVKHAKLAESVGFDGILISEHFHPWVDDHSAAGFAFSTLGAIAVSTRKVKLVTAVTTPLFRYHPAIVAQAAATIDRLSNGRFELGVGTGETINEKPLGYSFPKYGQRADRMAEAIEIIRRLFNGEKLTFKGKYYQTDRVKLYSPPIGKVPIWMAAAGPKSAALAASKADGVIVSVKEPIETIKNVINPAKKAATKNKKPGPKILATRWCIFAKNKDEAWRALLPWRGLRVAGRDTAIDPADLRRQADSLPQDVVLNKYIVISKASDFINAYLPLISEIKSDIVSIQTTSVNQEATIKTLGAKVLPALRKAARIK